MSLDTLPLELFKSQIVELLGTQDAASLARTSRHCRAACAEALDPVKAN